MVSGAVSASPAGIAGHVGPTGLDDVVCPFVIDQAPIRGRIARLGSASIDPILKRHSYPRPVATVLGEAVVLAALIGTAMKHTGRLIVQVEGDGPVSFVVAEYRAALGVRGYAKINVVRFRQMFGDDPPGRLPIAAMFGAGAFAMTLDQGPDTERYQGIAPLEGDTLAACAEHYFMQSEQTPTRFRLTVAESLIDGLSRWRAGGLFLQRMAGDTARGEADDEWETAQTHFSTIGDDELTDPMLGADRLLYRLFHEQGVRLAQPNEVVERCTCDRGRFLTVLRGFDQAELRAMALDDGLLHAHCEFCGRTYIIAPDEIGADGPDLDG